MNMDTVIGNPLEVGADELEQMALAECIKRQRIDRRVSVLILPATSCDFAVQLARQGAQVTLANEPSQQQALEGRILASGMRDEIRFAPYHLPELPNCPVGEPYDIIYFRRSLCALPYREASQVVRDLMKKSRIGGKLYISILGLHSALGENYADAELDIRDRYTGLSPHLVDKYNIKGPVCLYTERDLFMLLLESGVSVLRTLTTTYGNVKAVAVRV